MTCPSGRVLDSPQGEHAVNAFDAELGIEWSSAEVTTSERDPSLADARRAGLLPEYAECMAYLDQLRSAELNPRAPADR